MISSTFTLTLATFALLAIVVVADININANVSEVGFNRSFGVMVNYLYELKNIEKNHEDYINNKKVIISDKLKKFI